MAETAVVLLEGWLTKRGEKSARNWRKRWFVLRKESGCTVLAYHKRFGDATAGEFELTGHSYIEGGDFMGGLGFTLHNVAVRRRKSRDVDAGSRLIHLAAASPAAKGEWVVALGAALQAIEQNVELPTVQAPHKEAERMVKADHDGADIERTGSEEMTIRDEAAEAKAAISQRAEAKAQERRERRASHDSRLHDSEEEATSLNTLPRKKMVLMVSAPETGPDGSGGFSFPVMKSISKLSQADENMVVAYDWAGSSNVFPEDKRKFDMIFEEPTSGKGNNTLFKKWCDAPNKLVKEKALEEITSLVKDTRWFAAYCGAVKNTIKVFCQKNEEVLLVCIEGGPITRVSGG
jgi:hypothetical protein